MTLNFEVLLLQRGQLDISSLCWVCALFLSGMCKRVAFANAAFHTLLVLCAFGDPASTLSCAMKGAMLVIVCQSIRPCSFGLGGVHELDTTSIAQYFWACQHLRTPERCFRCSTAHAKLQERGGLVQKPCMLCGRTVCVHRCSSSMLPCCQLQSSCLQDTCSPSPSSHKAYADMRRFMSVARCLSAWSQGLQSNCTVCREHYKLATGSLATPSVSSTPQRGRLNSQQQLKQPRDVSKSQ